MSAANDNRAQPEGLNAFLSVGNTSAYLDLQNRYNGVLEQLVSIAALSLWRTREETHDALSVLLDRELETPREAFRAFLDRFRGDADKACAHDHDKGLDR